MLERTLPAVVTITVRVSDAMKTPFGFSPPAKDVAYQRALDLAGVKSTGSGFVIEHKGKKYVVTNAHVIEHAKASSGAVFAWSVSRTKYSVRVIGGDSFYDLAVLEFIGEPPNDDVTSLVFRSTEARIGKTVYALGNPGGRYPYAVTQGIIGAKNRVLGGTTGKFGYLQSTATTFTGNSGGLLLDSQGTVLGVSSQVGVIDGTWQPQLDFALEAPIAERVVTDILHNHGRVIRAYFGLIVAQDKHKACVRSGQCEKPVLLGVVSGSPGESLHARIGASLTKLNGTPVATVQDCLGEMEKARPGICFR